MASLATYQWSKPDPIMSSSSRIDVVCVILASSTLELPPDSPYISQILEFIVSRTRESISYAEEFNHFHVLRQGIAKWGERHHVARCERFLVEYRCERDLGVLHDGFSAWALLLSQNKMRESNAAYHHSNHVRTFTFSSLKEALKIKRRNRSDAIVYSNYKILLSSWTRIITTYETRNEAYDRQSQVLAASYHKTRVYKSVLMSLYDAVLARKANVTESARIFLDEKRRRLFAAWRERARYEERVGVFQNWRDEVWAKGFFKHWVGVRRLILRNKEVAVDRANRYDC